jgi:hypothetical protein
MQKKLMLVISIISILGMLFGVAAAPAVTKSVVLDDVRFIAGKGYVFLFTFKGAFKQSELSGFVNIGSDGFDLACKLRDDGKISCVAIQLSPSYAGREAVVHLAGFIFYATIPGFPCNSIDFTLTVYDKIVGYIGGPYSGNMSTSDWASFKKSIDFINSDPNFPQIIVINSAICSPHQPNAVLA